MLAWPGDTGSGSVNPPSSKGRCRCGHKELAMNRRSQNPRNTGCSGDRIAGVFYVVADWEQATNQTLHGAAGVKLFGRALTCCASMWTRHLAVPATSPSRHSLWVARSRSGLRFCSALVSGAASWSDSLANILWDLGIEVVGVNIQNVDLICRTSAIT